MSFVVVEKVTDMEETSFKVEKLTAENYHTWKFNIKMFLIGKDLWDVVQGTKVLSDEVCDDERRKYKKRENLSLSIICLSVQIKEGRLGRT